VEREKPDPVDTHRKKIRIAATETGLFLAASLIYPPALLGAMVTMSAAFIEVESAIGELQKDVNELDGKISEHALSHDHGEPIPPNPETATQDEIDAYKRAVLEAANTPPENQITEAGKF
jgi:hypothetical protein